MKLILFVETNVTTLNHLLTVIDRHTLVFENHNFQHFFKKMYSKRSSTLRRLIEHPGLLRAYFQLKNSARKLKDKFHLKPEKGTNNDHMKELLPTVINSFESFVDTKKKSQPVSSMGQLPPSEDAEYVSIQHNLFKTKALLKLQTISSSSLLRVYSRDVA